MRRKGIQRAVAVIVAAIMALTGFPLGELAIYAAEPNRLELKNEYININVNTEDGRFSSRTTGGDPRRATDENKNILYNRGKQDTSYTSFVIDGEEVVYGHEYGPALARHGYFLQKPRLDGNRIVSIWKYKDVKITQNIALMADDSLQLQGNAIVSYEVQNESEKPVKFGTRILLDVMAGDNDGPIVQKSGDLFPITGEREFKEDKVPLYWQTVDNLDRPQISSYGMLYGWSDAKPSKVVFGHWSGLSSTKWTYEINQWLDYSSADNTFGTADSAVAVYWDEKPIPAGGTATFSTLLGMGDLQQQGLNDELFLINITAPKRIEADPGEKITFEVSAEIDNSLPASVDLNEVMVELAYPTDVVVNRGQSSRYFMLKLPKNDKPSFNWTIEASAKETVEVFNFEVQVSVGDTTRRQKVYVVVMPSFQTPPKIQYTTVAPNEMYYGEKLRKVIIRGSNLGYLKDSPERWSMYIQNDENGQRTPIPANQVTVDSDQQISVFLPENMNLGTYGLGVEHELGDGFYRPNMIRISMDASLMKRGYGTVLITKKEEKIPLDGSNESMTVTENSVYLFSKYETINVPQGEKEVLRLTGDVEKLSDRKYSIFVSKATPVSLGNVVRIDPKEGEAVSEITVDLRTVDYRHPQLGDPEYRLHAHVSVDDKANMYLTAKPRDWPNQKSEPLIWKSRFSFNVNDFVIKHPNVMGLSDDINAYLGQFKIGIQELQLYYDEEEKQYAVSLKGGLDILGLLKEIYNTFGATTEDYVRRLFYANVHLDRFIIYQNGWYDVVAEAGIGLPQLRFGNVFYSSYTEPSKGTTGIEGRLRIDTKQDIYSVAVNLSMPGMTKMSNPNPSVGYPQDNGSSFQGKIGFFLIWTPVGIAIPVPDTVEAEFKDKLGFVQIPNIPFAINQLGGGIYDLHKIRDAIRGGEFPDSHVRFRFGITDTATPLFFGKRMFSLSDATIALGLTKMSFGGTGNFYIVPVLQTEFGLMFYPVTGAYWWGKVDIFDTIIGEAKVEISYNHHTSKFYAGGYLTGRVQIPNKSPIFPGYKLAEAMAAINTDYVHAYGYIGLVGLGIKYHWASNDFQFGTGKPNIPGIAMRNEDGSEHYAVIGTNLYEVATRPGQYRLYDGPVRLADADGSVNTLERLYALGLLQTTETMFASEGKDGMLIQAKYAADEEMQVTLTDPDNNEYHLVENGAAANVFRSEYDDPDTGERMKYVAITIPASDNKEGTWTISSNVPAKFEAFGAISAIHIDEVQVAQVGDLQYRAELELSHVDPALESRVDLYLERMDGGEGSLISIVQDEELVLNAERKGQITFNLPPTVENGTYRIVAGLKQYAGAVDEDNMILYTQNESEGFAVVNTSLPAQPQNVTAKAIGNGILQVSWDAVKEPDITGYYIAALDESGQLAPGTDTVFVQADAELDRLETSIRGWRTDQTYRITVRAVRSKDKDDGAKESNLVDVVKVDDADVEVTDLSGTGKYKVEWAPLDGIDEYVVIVEDPSGHHVTVPYYHTEDKEDGTGRMHTIVPGLVTGIDYNVTVMGWQQRDLQAKNVTVTNIAADDDEWISKEIGWDAVQIDDLDFYQIIGKVTEVVDGEEITEIAYMQQFRDIPENQPASYKVKFEGFDRDLDYDISVIAMPKEKQAEITLGNPSEPVEVRLPSIEPPKFQISVYPTDEEGKGIVQVVADELDVPYFSLNVQDVMLQYNSSTPGVVKSEAWINPSQHIAAEEELNVMEGDQWQLPLHLQEGMNEIQIKSYNAQGDTWEETYYFVVRTIHPILRMNDSTVVDGLVTVSGLVDEDAELYVNGEPVSMDMVQMLDVEPVEIRKERPFMVQFEAPNTAIIPIVVRAVDSLGNESVYKEQLVNDELSDIVRVEIAMADTMANGTQQPLILEAFDADGKSVVLPKEHVEWEVIEGAENVEISHGYINALREGQAVISAKYWVNEQFAWEDYFVVEVGPGDSLAAVQDAYLLGIETSTGTLSPVFTSGRAQYRWDVPYSAAAVTLRPTTDLADAVIRVNGEIVENGQRSKQIMLELGDNTIVVTVDAPGRLNYQYTILAHRMNHNGGGGGSSDDWNSDESMQQVTPPNQTVEQQIDPSRGGTVTYAGATLNIPPGAFDKPFKVSVGIVPNAPSLPISSQMKLVSQVYEFTKDEEGHFSKPVKLSLPFDPSLVDWNHEQVALFWLDESTGEWNMLDDIEVDPTGTVSGQVTHFTKFAALAEKITGSIEQPEFGDLAGHWAETIIKRWLERGLVSGYPDGTFQPDRPISRAEFVTLLVKAFQANTPLSSTTFADTTGHWAREAIAIAYARGWVSGYDNNTFGPDDALTREQMVSILMRALNSGDTAEESGLHFIDRDRIAPWAEPHVASATQRNIVSGFPDGTFQPQARATRAEALKVLDQALGLNK